MLSTINHKYSFNWNNKWLLCNHKVNSYFWWQGQRERTIVFKVLHYKFKPEVRMQSKNVITIVHSMSGMIGPLTTDYMVSMTTDYMVSMFLSFSLQRTQVYTRSEGSPLSIGRYIL